MMRILEAIIDRLKGKTPRLVLRSSKWAGTRKKHLLAFPTCAVCDGRKQLSVHHLVPFHVDPSRELSTDNLLTLCESKKFGVNCHLFVGHFGTWQRVNPGAVVDSKFWNQKLLRLV